MEPVTHTEIARRHARSLSELSGKRQRAYRAAVDNGTATVRLADDPLPDHWTEQVVRSGGAVYSLTVERAGTEAITAYRYTVEFEDPETPSDAGTMGFSSLPAADRAALADRSLSNPGADERFDIGVTLAYAPAERNASVLVPTPEEPVLRWPSGATARVSVVDETVEQTHRYRIDAAEIGSLAAYGRQFEERVAFALANTSAAEAQVLDRAIERESGYTVPADATPTPPLDAGVERLRRRFAGREGFPRGTRHTSDELRTYLVEYGNRTYWAEQ
jgi:hypothetical protein